jgi:hypothetical protein
MTLPILGVWGFFSPNFATCLAWHHGKQGISEIRVSSSDVN